MPRDFGTKLKSLLDNPWNSEFRLDSACALACKEIGASSASVLVYSGKDDRLQWAGRYIDTVTGDIDTGDNEILLKIMTHMCACEYLHSQKNSLHESIDNLFKDYNKRIPTQSKTTIDDFTNLANSFEEWLDLFNKIKATYHHEEFSITIDAKTVTGEWYQKLLKSKGHIPNDLFIKEIILIDKEIKNSCIKPLKDELKISFSPRYYIALPLNAKGRNLGVLRFLFPENAPIIKDVDGNLCLKEDTKETLESMCQSFSLHLEIAHMDESQKETIRKTQENVDEPSSFAKYLNLQCELLSGITKCKGALILRLNRKNAEPTIVGASKNMEPYHKDIVECDSTFFRHIAEEFSKDCSILCIYFNLFDEPLEINKCLYDRDKQEFITRKVPLIFPSIKNQEKSIRNLDASIANLMVFPSRQNPGFFIFFFSSEHRRFNDHDFQQLYPTLYYFDQELKERNHLLENKRRMGFIHQMHEDTSRIPETRGKKSFEYVDDFSKEISRLIQRLRIFQHHIIWDCMTQEAPTNAPIVENFLLLDATEVKYRKTPIICIGAFSDYPRKKIITLRIPKKEFMEKFSSSFKAGKPENVFYIPLESGYSYFNLPIYAESDPMPRWILTLIYMDEYTQMVNNADFYQFMEQLSHQISLAWDKFHWTVSSRLLEKIDIRLTEIDKTRNNSTMDQLTAISKILARELRAEWCAFFLVNEEKKKLKLATANLDLEFQLHYSLSDSGNLIVQCFNNNEDLRLSGRLSLEEIIKTDSLKAIERRIRAKRKREKARTGKKGFTPFVLFEHALFCPVYFGTDKLGIMTLYRSRKAGKPDAVERFDIARKPFARFETHLLRRVKRYVFNIFVSHHGAQKRMQDIRSINAEVSAPLSAAISFMEEALPKDGSWIEIDPQKLQEKLRYANAMARIATQYAANFEKLLDIDSRKIKLVKSKIKDLRYYLIEFAMIYSPVSLRKLIHINVTQETASNICLEVDKDYFDIVMVNLIDNAVKYSFFPEERQDYGLQEKPNDVEDKENVLITARETDEFVFIRISNYGIEIKEEEKKHIFAREFRGSKAHDRGKGTGIGLFLVNEIIRLHNGTIELVPNTPKDNTIFEIKLPKGQKI